MRRTVLQVFSFDFISRVLLGVAAVLLIRFMPVEEYAAYSLAASIAGVAATAMSNSVNRIFVVSAARDPADSSVGVYLGLQLALAVGANLLFLPFLAGLGSLAWLVVLLGVAILLSNYAKTVVQQEERFRAYSLIEIARSGLYFAAIAALIAVRAEAIGAAEALTAQAAAMAVVVFVVLRGRRGLLDFLKWRRVLDLGKRIATGPYRFLFAYSVAVALQGQLPIYTLKIWSTSEQLATYGAAFRYYSLLLLALGSIHAVLLPVVQRLDTAAEVEKLLKEHSKTVAVFAAAIVVGLWLSAWVLPFLDGGRYPLVVPTFRILAISALFSFALSPHVHIVMRFEEFKPLFWAALAAILVIGGVAAIAVPGWGARGAAGAALIGYATLNVWIYNKARQLRRRWKADDAMSEGDVPGRAQR